MSTSLTRTLRNSDLKTLAQTLSDQQAHKLDMVLPVSAVRFNSGKLQITDADPIINKDGVTDPNGSYVLTDTALTQIADKIQIPIKYLRRLSTTPGAAPLFDLNLNFWTQNVAATSTPDHPDTTLDTRSFLVRTFNIPGQDGICRALLSDSYGFRDHLDTLMAFLAGIKQTGLTDIAVRRADLSDNRMYVTISSPAITAAAPSLLGNYRSPFSGQSGRDLPIVEAGISLRNSETGGGAWVLSPELRVQVCSNGMTITKDTMRSVHLGSKLEHGSIQWSQKTMEADNDLLTSKVQDAVTSWLSPTYLQTTLDELSTLGEKKLEKPQDTIQFVSKELKYSQEEQDGILNMFISSGDLRSSGILHAVTAYSQVIEDPDRAFDFQSTGVKALELAFNHG